MLAAKGSPGTSRHKDGPQATCGLADGRLSSSEVNKNRACSHAQSQEPAKTSRTPSHLILSASDKLQSFPLRAQEAGPQTDRATFPGCSRPAGEAEPGFRPCQADQSPASSLGGRNGPRDPQMPRPGAALHREGALRTSPGLN